MTRAAADRRALGERYSSAAIDIKSSGYGYPRQYGAVAGATAIERSLVLDKVGVAADPTRIVDGMHAVRSV